MTDREIRGQFPEVSDFIPRQLRCCGFTIYAYAIDGLVSGGDMSEYILKPIAEHLRGQTMGELYEKALHGAVYNSVAEPCEDLQTVFKKLVNGFCVVLFPEAGAIAFEIRGQPWAGCPGGGEHRQGAKGCFRGDHPHQYQPPAAASSHTGSTDFCLNRGKTEPDQCGGGMD